MIRISKFYFLPIIFFSFQWLQASPMILELNEAIQRAYTYSPTVMVANSEIDIKQAEECQARLLPNPTLTVEIDGADSFISKRKNGNDNRDIIISLSQLIELGGKRFTRKQIAAFQSTLTIYESESVKLDVINAVTKAFIDVIAAQENLKLVTEQQRIAQEVFTTTSAKVQGGKVSSLQEKKANLQRISTSLALERAQREFELAKKKLAATWGNPCLDFTEVVFPLFELTCIPALDLLIAQQNQGLVVRIWDMEIAIAEQIIISEKAQRIPDVVVTAGYATYPHDDNSFLFSFSLPIPVFDRNQGNICRAKHELQQLYQRQNESKIQLRIELEEAYNQLLTAYHQGLSFKENILAAAQAAFEAAKEEYTQGKNDYLELLDAQRTLFEVQQQYINTLVDFHYMQADVNRLVGLPKFLGGG